MRRIRSKGMKPEIAVRQLVHSLGYRYRLHAKELPGRPDLVFRPRKKVIFVHGCFWHQHPSTWCKIVRKPKSNTGYWLTKLETNVARDAQNIKALRSDGWKVLILWECQVANREKITQIIHKFLGKAVRENWGTQNTGQTSEFDDS